MINVRGLANNIANVINDNCPVTILRSDGYTIGDGRKQIPKYEYPISGNAQVQALDHADLKQLQGLNMEGVYRAIYLCGSLHGVIRKTGEGGDLVKYNNQTWLITKILETWPTWTKAVICLQVD
jgi:hypothetical protein